jgi:hypothetical protein
MTSDVVLNLMHLLTNDPTFFQLIQRITGCGRIGCFTGRVYRMMQGCGHYDSWHDDVTEDRMLAMSINLSSGTYSGGILQIRDSNSHRLIHQVANVGFGDGIIFRIASSLEHRVTLVDGTAPKTAFAGWFRSQTDFLSLLRNESSELR